MKKYIALLLVMVMSLSLVACGNKVSKIEVDGKKVSVTDFLIEHLGEYMSTEEFAAREARFLEMFDGSDPIPFTVTRVMEVFDDEIGANKTTAHYLLVKADWGWAKENNGDTTIALVVNYNTGVVLDSYMVDESALEVPDSQEYLDYVLLHCAFISHDYVDQIILTPTEKRTELSEVDIAKINEGLSK